MINIGTAEHQLKTEWESKFITDLYVIDASQNCKVGERPLFTYDWKGLKAFYKYPNGKLTIASSYTKNRGGKKVTVQLDLVGPGFPAIEATVFDNKKICVTNGG